MTKIEEVARAIVTADEQNGGPPWDYLMTQGKHVIGPIFDRARAALEAMKRPTIKMEHEFLTAWFGIIQPTEGLYRDQLHRAFNTMIQSALEEK